MENQNIDYDTLKESDGYIIPQHYMGNKYQSIEIFRNILTKKQYIGFCTGLSIKYLTRITDDNRERSLKKAKYYIDELLNYLTAQGEKVDNSRVRPHYYKKKDIETIDIIEDQFEKELVDGFYIGIVLKYLFRCTKKYMADDLAKAKYYLDRYIEKYL